MSIIFECFCFSWGTELTRVLRHDLCFKEFFISIERERERERDRVVLLLFKNIGKRTNKKHFKEISKLG